MFNQDLLIEQLEYNHEENSKEIKNIGNMTVGNVSFGAVVTLESLKIKNNYIDSLIMLIKDGVFQD